VLSVKSMSASYGDSSVIRDISIKSRKGQVVCILGRNGVGKTTLLKGIMGLVKTPSGSVSLDDTELSRLPTYKRASIGRHLAFRIPYGWDIKSCSWVVFNCAKKYGPSSRFLQYVAAL